MDTDQGHALLRRGNHSNPLPHYIPPRGGLLENKLRPGHELFHRRELLEMFGFPGHMDTNQGQAPLRRGNHSNLSPHEIPPRRVPLAIFFEDISMTMNGDVLPVMAMKGGG